MNSFDRTLISTFSWLSGRSVVFDQLMIALSSNHFAKGGVIMAILWGVWFTSGGHETIYNVRAAILAAFFGSGLALILVRVLVHLLPFRSRPRYALIDTFAWPAVGSEALASVPMTNSFPSDHAALFSGLVCGLFFISRRFGYITTLYVLVIILWPRLYLGFHYPTDILAGALLGMVGTVTVTYLSNRYSGPRRLFVSLLRAEECYRFPFYACFFLISFEVGEIFDGSRALGSFAAGLLVHRLLP